jgi:Tfp pilus assembly protein PilN
MHETININLLPGAKKRRKQLSRENKQIITIGLIVLIALVLFYGGLRYEVFQRNRYLESLKSQIASLNNVEKTLTERNQLGDKVYLLETTIEKLVNSQITWNNLITQIGDTLPKDAYIDSIDVDREKNQVTLTGHTTDLQRLAWTVNSLKSNAKFQNLQVEHYTIPLGLVTPKGEPEYATFSLMFQWGEIKQ